MGLAVLPARLKGEMAALERAILSKTDLRSEETLAKHADWVEEFLPRYEDVNAENIHSIVQKEIGPGLHAGAGGRGRLQEDGGRTGRI